MIKKRTIQRIELASTVESLSKVEQFVETVCDEHNFGEDCYGNVLIAVTEAMNNAIIHGNKLNPNKQVILEMTATTSQIEFVIEDEGIGFNYRNVPDPTLPENIEKIRGRGIFLIKALADTVEFEEQGRKISITFSKPKG